MQKKNPTTEPQDLNGADIQAISEDDSTLAISCNGGKGKGKGDEKGKGSPKVFAATNYSDTVSQNASHFS